MHLYTKLVLLLAPSSALLQVHTRLAKAILHKAKVDAMQQREALLAQAELLFAAAADIDDALAKLERGEAMAEPPVVTRTAPPPGIGAARCTRAFPYVCWPTSVARRFDDSAALKSSAAEAVPASTSTTIGSRTGAGPEADFTVTPVRARIVAIVFPPSKNKSTALTAASRSPPPLPRRSSAKLLAPSRRS